MKKYLFGKTAKEKIFEGMKLMHDCVSPTVGPKGRNVAIDVRGQVVELTKDGVSVAEQVHAEGWQGMGCRLMREASQNTNESSGDGTTSTVILALEMCAKALHLPDVRVISVKSGIDKAIDKCKEVIKKESKKIKTEEEFKKVATISSQSSEVGEVVTKAFMDAGENGSIEIERAEEPGIEVEKTDGISFDKGYVLPECVNKGLSAVQEDIPVLVTDKSISSQLHLAKLMQQLAQNGTTKLMVIADDFKGEAVGMMSANLQQRSFHVIAVRAPGYGKNKIELLKDIAAATNSEFISEENGLRFEKATIENLGKARRVTVEKERTVIVGEDTDEVKEKVFERVEAIHESLKEEKDDIKVDDLKNRLAILTDGITVLKVGGQTNQERRELKHRVEDAVRSLQSSREEGVVGGCGSVYLTCQKALEGLCEGDEQVGVEIVRDSLPSVSLRVLEVAGVKDKEHLVSMMRDQGTGYDFNTGELVNMLDNDIYDAAKVTRDCLENAAAVCKSFLTIDVGILWEDDKLSMIDKLRSWFK